MSHHNGQTPSPCDTCPSATRCRKLQLACRSYYAWTDQSRKWHAMARRPSRAIYIQVFG